MVGPTGRAFEAVSRRATSLLAGHGRRPRSCVTVRTITRSTPPRSDMGVVNWNGVGGGTVLYNAQWPRMLPDDFRVHAIDGVARDWPLTYEELAPFYERIDQQFMVSGLGGNPAFPEGAEPPLPPLPIGKGGLKVARAHARLGWHWWPETNAIASVDIDESRHRCAQRGTCGQGCGEGAKASTDLTHWPQAIAAGARLITGARVREITVGADGRVTGALWLDEQHREHQLTADIVLSRPTASAPAAAAEFHSSLFPTDWPTHPGWSDGG